MNTFWQTLDASSLVWVCLLWAAIAYKIFKLCLVATVHLIMQGPTAKQLVMYPNVKLQKCNLPVEDRPNLVRSLWFPSVVTYNCKKLWFGVTLLLFDCLPIM